MKAHAVPKAAVARLFIARQHLDARRPLTARTLSSFVSDAGGLQIDTINVVERAHYLTLWSRFGPYEKAKVDRLIYENRVLGEYWAHAACFVAASDLPYWRRAMLDYRPYSSGWGDWLRASRSLLARVEGAIRSRGPLSSSSFERPEPRKGGGWWDWKPATHALQYLWWTGRIAVASRRNFEKRYDLMSRVFPRLAPAVDSEGFARWHLRKSLRAMGAASELDLRMYLTYPRWEAERRRKTLAKLLSSGEAVAVAVEGERKPWYALADDVPALEASGDSPRGTTLLSPFDSFLWHRERTRALFGFDYKVEIYVPGAKRVHGYYSMPILHDGRLIGRLDPKSFRAERRLEIRALHFEPAFAKGPGREAGLRGTARAIGELARFTGAERVRLGPVSPSGVKLPPLPDGLV